MAAAVFLLAGALARRENIYPNVSIGGIGLGGMSREQARRALEASQFGAYNGKSITVEFTHNGDTVGSLTVTAAAAGLERDCGALAQAAYMCGRSEGFAAGAVGYLRCFFGAEEPPVTEEPSPDLGAIRAAAGSAGLDVPPTEDVIFAGDGEIHFTRGTPGRRVNTEAAAESIAAAFEQMRFEPVSCPMETLYPADTDPEAVYEMIHIPPSDAYFDELFNVVPEVVGQTPDGDLAAAIGGTEYGGSVTLPIRLLQPSVFAGELRALLYRDMLSSATTELTANETRSQNIAIATGAINGAILLPDKVFSYNDALGERTVEKGYGKANAYVNGQVVQEVGGGICQLSSTLYYCCLLADLDIVFRTGHMYYQTYVPYGMDATVSWGYPDYKFRNSTEYPVKIIAHRDGNTVTVELWGTKTDGNYVKMEYSVDEHIPCRVSYVEDPALKPGSQVVTDYGRDGMTVSTYRCRYSADGTLIDRSLEAVSRYSARDKVIHTAPKER